MIINSTIIVILCLLFYDSFPKVFLDMSRFVAVMTFWYVFMPKVFSFLHVFTASCAGTFVLGVSILGFPRLSGILQVISIVCESSFLSRQYVHQVFVGFL